jgi:hypothetical protein
VREVGLKVPVTVLEPYAPPNFTFFAPFTWSALSTMVLVELTTALWQLKHFTPSLECFECFPVDGGP